MTDSHDTTDIDTDAPLMSRSKNELIADALTRTVKAHAEGVLRTYSIHFQVRDGIRRWHPSKVEHEELARAWRSFLDAVAVYQITKPTMAWTPRQELEMAHQTRTMLNHTLDATNRDPHEDTALAAALADLPERFREHNRQVLGTTAPA